MKKIYWLVIILGFYGLFCNAIVCGQVVKTVDHYIQEGLHRNQALKLKNFDFQKSLTVLEEAKGLFYPRISTSLRYSRNHDGRFVEVPTGEMLTPIYQGLNEIASRFGETPPYPSHVPDYKMYLLPENEWEIEWHLKQPIYEPKIYHNYQIQKGLSQVERIKRTIFIRHLVADIKSSLFKYYQTEHVGEIYRKTKKLLQENLRVSQKLFKYQKATKDVVLWAEAEISEVDEKYAAAKKDIQLAKYYFNFLLNRPLNTPILNLSEDALEWRQDYTIDILEEKAIQQRDEFKQLQVLLNIADEKIDLAQSAYHPRVGVQVTYGFLKDTPKFGEDYVAATVLLNWDLFDGWQRGQREKQAKIDKQAIRVRKSELEEKIKLEVREAFEDLTVALKKIETNKKQIQSAKELFEIITKKYRQGMATQVENLDAQTRLTNAEIKEIIAKYAYQIKASHLERVCALYSINE